MSQGFIALITVKISQSSKKYSEVEAIDCLQLLQKNTLLLDLNFACMDVYAIPLTFLNSGDKIENLLKGFSS